MKQAVVTEAAILAATRKYLRMRGWYVIRNQQNMGSHKGMADLQAIKDGKTVYIETKRPGGKLSPVQEHFRDCVEGHGAQFVVIASFDDVVCKINDLDTDKGVSG